MKLDIHSVSGMLLLLLLLLMLTSSSQAGGQSAASVSTMVALVRDDAQVTSQPAHALHQRTSNTAAPAIHATEETLQTTSIAERISSSAEQVSPTSGLTAAPPLLHSSTVVTTQVVASTITSPKPVLTSTSALSPPSSGHLSPTHVEFPSQLKVGDEDFKAHRSRPNLDPLLAGLLSIFIITTAVVFVVLFLKFRQRTNNPEFHRLQDLPMDDLMEDTPLSRYSY
ncbi:uncharacterized protein LOC128769755 [Synchiropus splendidus]|uniref:uncharacterized protein LOC128769755 n=1 Tax=Synchiropus splendidus TaxID=270530 RepID=UPI00237E5734|nr:uncharacterized protein LOC128769755 [Synchiropus splendidus]